MSLLMYLGLLGNQHHFLIEKQNTAWCDAKRRPKCKWTDNEPFKQEQQAFLVHPLRPVCWPWTSHWISFFLFLSFYFGLQMKNLLIVKVIHNEIFHFYWCITIELKYLFSTPKRYKERLCCLIFMATSEVNFFSCL